ncbi:mechanosensitive ion channel family protein [Kineosporia sp. J2-2]|uniref:Mechanosensitive ion channel family protein n=1 Tax=Kineosporia corallincola TaxID=2835133 RepID=A0ABS5TN18_9ACTN|nr:mechanosensitive ion channel family protein [Kineosporia corallincola]MBT0772238.1 mechanosensitive ion channel family protein [Kineosporia corallincola]
MFAAPLVAAHVQLSALIASSTPDPTGTGTPTPTPTGSATATATASPSATSLSDQITGAFTDIQTRTETQTCSRDDFSICGLTLRVTGSSRLGQWLDFFLGTPLRIAFIVLIGWAIRKVVHRLIGRLADRVANGTMAPGRETGEAAEESRDDARVKAATPPMVTRRLARARTLAQVLRSVTTVVIFIVIGLMVLDEIGVEITPLLASLSVIGVALGLGAQSVVRDVLAGMFMILEDQYGVGDSVNVGEASGVVEAVGLRVTQLRDLNGTVWYVRNGEILSVGNHSQGWSRAVLDVNVAYDEDIDHVEDLLEEIAAQVRAEPKYGAVIMEDPELWGVETMTQDSVVVRMVIKTYPDQSAPVAREMRRRIRLRFAREGIYMHSTPRTVIVGQGEAAPPMSPAFGTPPSPEAGTEASPTADSSSKRHPEERELGR